MKNSALSETLWFLFNNRFEGQHAVFLDLFDYFLNN